MPKLTYPKAKKELESILSDLESGELAIDQLAKKVKRAKELIHWCQEKLRDIEADLSDQDDSEE